MEPTLYLGPSEVDKLEILDHKTPAGKEIVRVLFKSKDAFSEEMPLSVFNLCKTIAPIDYNTLRERQHEALIVLLTELMLEYGVKKGNVGYVLTSLKDKLATVFDRSLQFLTTGDDLRFVPGMDPLTDFTLLQAEATLRRIQKDGKSS